jgi:hypothetical protein
MVKTIIVVMLLTSAAAAQAPQTMWLDRPLATWNVPGRAMPRAKTHDQTPAEIAKRCGFQPAAPTTPGEREVAAAGWLPFHMFDRRIVQGDVEIIGGLAGADGMCRPDMFNVFVFVAGKLAGTLSPEEMRPRSDGSIGGAVRLAEDGTIAAEFARYTERDPLCCPAARVTVRYRIDRTSPLAVVVPVAIAPTRR